jgi:hypothetical protein
MTVTEQPRHPPASNCIPISKKLMYKRVQAATKHKTTQFSSYMVQGSGKTGILTILIMLQQ